MVDASVSEWRDPERVLNYLDRADGFPHRAEGESVLLEQVPCDAGRVLDLGTGDGRLLALLKQGHPEIVGVGLDFSEVMLDAARKRFADDEQVELVQHDLSEPLTESPTHRLHLAFFEAIGEPIEDEDPSDRLLDVHTQLEWLRELGFDDVDCSWKWREMALLIGVKPPQDRQSR